MCSPGAGRAQGGQRLPGALGSSLCARVASTAAPHSWSPVGSSSQLCPPAAWFWEQQAPFATWEGSSAHAWGGRGEGEAPFEGPCFIPAFLRSRLLFCKLLILDEAWLVNFCSFSPRPCYRIVLPRGLLARLVPVSERWLILLKVPVHKIGVPGGPVTSLGWEWTFKVQSEWFVHLTDNFPQHVCSTFAQISGHEACNKQSSNKDK